MLILRLDGNCAEVEIAPIRLDNFVELCLNQARVYFLGKVVSPVAVDNKGNRGFLKWNHAAGNGKNMPLRQGLPDLQLEDIVPDPLGNFGLRRGRV